MLGVKTAAYKGQKIATLDFFLLVLHHGSVLRRFIITVIVEEISKSIWKTVPWRMLFANDNVLVAGTKEEASSELEELKAILESRGLRISCTKTEYLRCNFSGTEWIGEPQVTIGGEVVACTSKFKYLGSVLQSDREIGVDVAHRIQAGLLKWRAATEVLCNIKLEIYHE
ncbi:uncharacterized protein LOC130808910 [Amaranthus tricolor]|uniref:uncharacterized protein LOC130808910 n=1 Tax=Amaranthus tricolor TaxID=29722 RepID=UPI002589AA24|nr:uncharacterized protein LOC130808910 [Amaranthus tricolor]